MFKIIYYLPGNLEGVLLIPSSEPIPPIPSDQRERLLKCPVQP